MPCNCDHLEPRGEEVRMSKVACLLDEFDGKPFNRNHWQGMHPAVYNQTYDRYAGNYDASQMVQKLVSKIQATDVTKLSLEMQIWWRDYQQEHNAKILQAEKEKQEQEIRQSALSKLTDGEKKALGF